MDAEGLITDLSGRNICVAGLGVSGRAAARVLAERGHRVTIVDRGTALGGQLLTVQRASGREEWQDITRYHVISQIAKGPVLDCPGLAIQYHQPRGIAGFDGRLGDEFLGEVVVEIAGFHGLTC